MSSFEIESKHCKQYYFKVIITGGTKCFTIRRLRRSSFHLDEQFVLVEVALNDPSLSLEEVLWEIRNSTGEYFALFTETSHGSDLLSK